MKVTPKVSKLTTNIDTENDKSVYELYLQLKIKYYEKILDLSRIEMHSDLELIHYFGIYIYKENDIYHVITGRSHINEIYKGEKHYGNVFIIDKNKDHPNPRMNISCYEKMELKKEYKILNVTKILFDFDQLFKDVGKENIVLEITKF